ncbi:shikimate 5-dehydrogenase [Gluconacetobacter sacchari DSM 12717]|uniref:Shikimate dehydrogenase (NADP(+)) n=2 Tax=Gluconacetobacter sacchari TaxID=92759 RepID=A0A7W4NSW4_9PROT|nr:shikimate dehydrogenase [Gluconacetobacter sacchari]MBB2161640.1 shikimate dehydrogenase [Gluconacetobacter sacchari]GBQ19123.1 shikimate 5-dehydrogenase [Gluconacetobacter sacchari DSM 12717]
MNWLCGLIGEGIAKSRSPAMHEREARNLGLPLVYRLVDTDNWQSDSRGLADILRWMERFHFNGTNVTHPYKQAVIPLLDELSDAALAIGAVNTVVFQGGRRIGHNTDWSGYAANFRRTLPDVSLNRVGQVGAGGAAAAVAYALLSMGAARLDIFDVASRRAADLAERLGSLFPEARVSAASCVEDVISGADGIVQTSPIGMDSHPGSPFSSDLLDASQWFSEVIYFPCETPLLAAARAKGCRTVSGVGMAVFQAADAFALFTGVAPDRDRMLSEFD